MSEGKAGNVMICSSGRFIIKCNDFNFLDSITILTIPSIFVCIYKKCSHLIIYYYRENTNFCLMTLFFLAHCWVGEGMN